MDTFNFICYLPWFLSVITKRDNFRTRSLDDEGALTKRHFSQLLPGYQTSTLVIMFTKWPLMNDLKRNFAYTPRTQNPPQALDYSVRQAVIAARRSVMLAYSRPVYRQSQRQVLKSF